MITPNQKEPVWLKSRGRIKVDKNEGRIVLEISNDFCNYYNWLIQRHFWKVFSISRFGAHVSLGLQKLHPHMSFIGAQKYAGKVVEFEYNPHIEIGGGSKDFTSFWMKVRSPELKEIKRNLGIIDGDKFMGLHVTLSSSKKQPKGVKFQPKMIEVR